MTLPGNPLLWTALAWIVGTGLGLFVGWLMVRDRSEPRADRALDAERHADLGWVGYAVPPCPSCGSTSTGWCLESTPSPYGTVRCLASGCGAVSTLGAGDAGGDFDRS